MINKSILIFLTTFLSFNLFSQIGINSWREHLPYKNAQFVTKDNEGNVYCGGELSLFYYSTEDNSITRLNKINGLSDVSFSALNFHEKSNSLIIAYENGNIDLIRNGNIYNMPDIKRKNIIGSKRINCITPHNNLAYLSMDFGIVVLDPVNREIVDTWYIGPEGNGIQVFDIDINDTVFMAATESGLYFSSFEGVNHAFYENWKKDTTLPNPDVKYNTACFYKDKILANNSNFAYDTDTVFIFQNGKWEQFTGLNHIPVSHLKAYGDTLIVVKEYGYDYFYNDLNDLWKTFKYNQADGNHKTPKPADIIRTDEGKLWVADENLGLVYNPSPYNYSFIAPEGPKYSSNFKMDIKNNSLWVSSGALNQSWNNEFTKKGVYQFYKEEWNSYNRFTNESFDTIGDVIAVEVHHTNPDKAYIGSWGKGLLELKNNEIINVYTSANSSLSEAINYPGFYAIGGLCFDDENNLWVTNSSTPNSLSVKKADGSWFSFNLSPFVSEDFVGDLIIDDIGQKWIILPKGNGIVVYNDNNTIENTFDDNRKKITSGSGNGNLSSNNVLSLAIDRDGLVWAGTDEGVVVFYNPENVFTGDDFDAQQIYVEEEGISQYLLESERVTCIAVDGANNKWFGTYKSGVFYMSDDGTSQIYHFTEDNSPLLSNRIMDIAIDNETGEVFFGTENGICSFRNVATTASLTSDSALVYPNPVHPGYNGMIAIKNLSQDANVKITDISSNVVFEGNAEGGQIVWNGKDLNGDRVSTGVYLVFATNEDGMLTKVSKIMFIK